MRRKEHLGVERERSPKKLGKNTQRFGSQYLKYIENVLDEGEQHVPNTAAIILCLLALSCGVFALGGLGLLITGKNRRRYVVVGTSTFVALAVTLTLGSLALW